MPGEGRQSATAAASAEAGFEAFYERTVGAAYSLALRITGDREHAAHACEGAYADAWQERAGAGAPRERDLLARVRVRALEIGAIPPSTEDEDGSYIGAKQVREVLARQQPEVRRALELAYFGGLPVSEISELLGMPAPPLRAAMRAALLELGALGRKGQEEDA
ncbi:MAG: sigma factor-like helix-turn-helix DNA-binding protein [Dehalococcoidia bacterium]